MHKTGHYGVAMIAYAPLGLVMANRGYPGLAVVGGVLVVALTSLPDVDLELSFVSHRGVTHTPVFALAVGGAIGGAIGLVLRETGLAGAGPGAELLVTFGFVVGAFAVLAHILGDFITPAGVPLLWPLTDRRFRIPVTKAGNEFANDALFALGLVALAVAGVLATGLVPVPV